MPVAKLALGEERCLGVNKETGRPCIHKKLEGVDYCANHNNNLIDYNNKKQLVRNYRLLRYQQRVNEFADNPEIKSLREEIGITRMILEEIINKCRDGDDLLLYSGKIGDIVTKIEKLVVSCHRLEWATGNLLDKSMIINIANNIIVTIGKHIKDPDDLEQISEDIMKDILSSVIPPDLSASKTIPNGA